MEIEPKYKDFSVEDFVWDSTFRQWVLNPDVASNKYWSEFINANSRMNETILSAKQIVTSVQVKNVSVADKEVEFAIQSVLNKMDVLQMDNKKYLFAKKHLFIAASVLITVCLMAWGGWKITANNTNNIYNKLVNSSNEHLVETVNTTHNVMLVRLSDGSKIGLGSNARISFPASFLNLNKRKVYLTGEAFFEVARNPSKPFFVYANGLVTKVLGTKFKIRAYENESTSTVEVTSGMVSVFSFADKTEQDEDRSKKLNSLILTRNQKANYSNLNSTLTIGIVNHPKLLDSSKLVYRFSAAPLPNVFSLIEEGYGIAIVYNNKSLLNRTFSADLESATLFQKLDIICKGINAHYVLAGGKIIIYNK